MTDKPETKMTAKATENMCLTALFDGMPGLTPVCAQTLAEAAAVCLESRSHQTGVLLPRAGLMPKDLHLEWLPVDDQSRRCYADMQKPPSGEPAGLPFLWSRK